MDESSTIDKENSRNKSFMSLKDPNLEELIDNDDSALLDPIPSSTNDDDSVEEKEEEDDDDDAGNNNNNDWHKEFEMLKTTVTRPIIDIAEVTKIATLQNSKRDNVAILEV